ncbi:MAG: aldose 1-epimerase, partial [Planctomycetes bacterium]|nr:aldose 1-epimerase [Planctomycetota bacterium]
NNLVSDMRSLQILAGFGFNCYSFEVMRDGELIETLWSAPDFETGTARPSGSGIPILFPFAGRIRGTRFGFDGREYELTPGDAMGNAIHGFVMNRPWKVIEQTANRAVGQFQASVVEPALLERWPSDFRLTVSYEIAGNVLRSELLVENPGKGPLPFGLGTHPYFRVPLGAKGNRDACRVQVPVNKVWELVNLLPTGRQFDAAGKHALAPGMNFSDTHFDDVFTGIGFDNHLATSSISDPGSGRRLVMTFDDTFRECVVYNPPHRQAICIEPYTCLPNPFELEQLSIDTGLRVLPPGKSARAKIEIRLK